MKTLNLKISLDGLKLGEEDNKKSPIEMSAIVIKNIMLGWASQQQKNMPEEDRRKFYKIADLFDKAVKENLDSVELEDDWMGFIRKCKREIGLMPNELVRRVEEKIDEVKDR